MSERRRESTGSEPLNLEAEGPRHSDPDRVRPSEASSARGTGNAAAIPKCIADQKYPLAAAVVITALLIAVIALAAKKTPPCAPCPPPVDAACPDGWVGYGGKCYYASEEERDWNISAVNCSSFGASLAVIDNQLDLDFLIKFTRPLHYWVGLSREAVEMPWRWPNGTEFKKQFPVRGGGLCAYLNDKGLSSTRCSTVNNFLCSKDDACITRRKRDASCSTSTTPSLGSYFFQDPKFQVTVLMAISHTMWKRQQEER